jgi:prepilin-type N-terminal cleavage/methylation domain-containing protein
VDFGLNRRPEVMALETGLAMMRVWHISRPEPYRLSHMKKPGIGKQARGFTLVELMVAIVIIAALAGLVFGIAKSTLMKSRMSANLTNVRSLGVEVQGYAQDNAGILPTWRDDSQDLYWWGMLVKDPKNESLLGKFKSPSDKEFDVNKIESTISYGWNARVVGRSADSAGDDGPKRLASFKQPAEILVLADTRKGAMGLIDEGALPDPDRYDGKAAGLMLDGSARTLTLENDFGANSKWFKTEEEREQSGN